MFDNTILVCNDELKEHGLEIVGQVQEMLKGRNYETVRLDEIDSSCFTGIDLVITIGGDATLLRPACYLKDIPILGIKGDPKSKGHLTSLDANNVFLLENILQGDYTLIQRQRAQATRNNELMDELVLNEVYFGTKDPKTSMRYVVCFKGHEEEHRGSGFVVATGTGSTARYSSMAQDPLSFEKRDVSFDYDAKLLKFLVDDLNRDYGNPILIHGEFGKEEKITLESRMNSNGYIAIDGCKKEYGFNKGDVVEVSLSDIPLNVVVPFST